MNDQYIKIDFFSLIIILGVIQGLFLSFFFLNKRFRRKPSNLYLGFIMLSLSLIILEIFLNYSGYMVRILRFDNFSEPLSLAVGPLMFSYIYSTITGKPPKRIWLHMMPMILWFLYSIVYYTYPLEWKSAQYMDYHNMKEIIQMPIARYSSDPLHLREYINEMVMVQLTSYLLASLVVIYRNLRLMELPFFAGNIKPLSWLRTFILLMLAILVSLILVKTIFVADVGDYIIASLIALVIYATSFNVIKSSDFFQENIADPFNPRKKYVKSALQDQEKDEILKQLRTSLEKDKDFKNNLVSLPYISKKIGRPVHHISQVINEKLQKSFFELIASYRIEEAKQLLLDPETCDRTVDDIAEDVGYNSKSAFNRSFKRYTGKTPTEYRMTHNGQSE